MEAILDKINWASTKNQVHNEVTLIPTVVKNMAGQVLGLLFSRNTSTSPSGEARSLLIWDPERDLD